MPETRLFCLNVFRSSDLRPASFSAAFACSLLLSAFAASMTLKMSLAASVSGFFSRQKLALEYPVIVLR